MSYDPQLQIDRPVEFWPEALDPDERTWTIREVDTINSCVDLLNKEASIPRARTRAQEQVRFHEMAHVAYTDEHKHEAAIMDQLCRMLEEVRVDAKLIYDRGIDVRHRHDDYDWAEMSAATTPLERACWVLQTAIHQSEPTIADDLRKFYETALKGCAPPLQKLLSEAIQDIVTDRSTKTRELHAKRLYDYFAPPPPPPRGMPKIKTSATSEIIRQEMEEHELEQAKKASEQEQQKRKQGAPIELPPPTYDPEEEEKLRDPHVGSWPKFGKAQIHDHIARQGKWRQVKAPFTRTGKGIVPEFMENYCIDRRIYRTDHRGGVLVIDTSGSMRPNWQLITQQMQQFPNLVVLSYRGVNGRLEAAGWNGRICVHARNGRIDPHFREEPGTVGGNDVDIEALEYGSKFKGPRVWISDGLACGGAYDRSEGYWNFNSHLQNKVREVMKQHHYIRVRTLEAALKWVDQSGPVEYAEVGLLETQDSTLTQADRKDMNPASKYYRKRRR